MNDSVNFGIQRFDVIIFFTWQYCLFAITSDDIFPIFLNYEPQFHCVFIENTTAKHNNTLASNWSTDCLRLKLCHESENSFLEFHSEYFSAVQEWSMYCGIQAFYASLIATVQCIGDVFGAVVASHASDNFGRKPVMVLLTLGCILFGTSSSFAPNWQILAVMRFIIGFVSTGLLVVGSCYTNELVKTKQRFLLVAFFNSAIARILLTACCHLTGHWRYASILIHLLELPLVVILHFLPESLVWLEEKGKMEELARSKELIAKINSEQFNSNSGANDEEKCSTSFKFAKQEMVHTAKDLFSGKHLTLVTLTLCFLHTSSVLLEYLVDLNSGYISGDFFLNQYILAVTISLSKPLGVVVDTYSENFSRRLFHQTPTFVVALCFIVATLSSCYQLSEIVTVVVNLIGTISVAFVWDSMLLITPELYPTEIRSIGFGFCTIISGFGAMAAPQLLFLRKFWDAAPFAAAAAVALLSLLTSCFFLPETKGTDLDTGQFCSSNGPNAASPE